MFRLTTPQANRTRSLFEIVDPVLSEGPIVFDREGCRFRGSNLIVYADTRIFASSPDITYEYTFEEDDITIGMNFKAVNDALSCVGPSDSVTFEGTQETLSAARPYITIRVFNDSNGYSFTSQICLLMLEDPELHVPERKFSTVVSMASSQFLKVLRFLQKKGEYVQIYTRNRKQGVSKTDALNDETESKTSTQYLCFRSEGDSAKSIYSEKVESDCIEECLKKERYSLKCLHIISKGTSLCNVVQLFLQVGDMLALKYRIGTIGSVIFCLSPSCEDAEDVPRLCINESKRKTERTQSSTKSFKRPVKRARKKRVVVESQSS